MTDQITKRELRIEIALALGATVTTETRKVYTYHIVTWQGNRVGIALTANDAWRKAFESGGIPDWPGDLGDAMTLCLEIALPNNWSVSVTPYGNSTFVAEFTDAKTDEHIADDIGETDALSLSRLAWIALKALAVQHG